MHQLADNHYFFMENNTDVFGVVPVDNTSFLPFGTRVNELCSNASSSPLLEEVEPDLLPRLIRRLSVDQLCDVNHSGGRETSRQVASALAYCLYFDGPSRPESNPSSSSSYSKSHLASDANQQGYTRFEESPPPSLPPDQPMENQLTASSFSFETTKPPSSFAQMSALRRWEFAEQFHDLSSMHGQSKVSWDDASRLFPTQFCISPGVALTIWKQVDTDGDLMLNEMEYCLAAHLAEKFAKTGFTILDQTSSSFPDVGNGDPPTAPVRPSLSPIRSSSPEQLLENHRNQSRRLLDESCDFLVSPLSTSIPVTPNPSEFPRRRSNVRYRSSDCSCVSNSSLQALEMAGDPVDTFDFAEDPFHHVEGEEGDESEIGEEDEEHEEGTTEVAALLPGSALTVPSRLLGCTSRASSSSSSSAASSSYSSSAASSSRSSSSSTSSIYDPSSIDLKVGSGEEEGVDRVSLRPRPDSFCSDSVQSNGELVDPIDVLSSVTGQSRLVLCESFTKHRRHRMLAKLVREAKSTNYTLLRLNNELAGELQELKDQHTNLNVQVRHMSLLHTPPDPSVPPPPPARKPT